MSRAALEPQIQSRAAAAANEAAREVRDALRRASAAAAARGMPEISPRGQMIRPLVALAGARGAGEPAPGEPFWNGVLALQLAHEASLVHDDIVDGAATRRGEPTLVEARGVAAALVQGDHLLTSAYCLATLTGSLSFVGAFARAVERTVAGEIAQGRSMGEALDFARYREIAMGKAGELLGCALATSALIGGRDEAPALVELGRKLGLLYQMLDDLLDYCPEADTGKPPLGDYRQRRWTWPLLELPGVGFGSDAAGVVARLATPGPGGSPLRRCLRRLEREADELRLALEGALGPSPVLAALLDDWLGRARAAVAAQEAAAPRAPETGRASPSRALRERLPEAASLADFFGRNSRSFQFAARLFPAEDRERVARVYAFCRVTDDLVDRPGEGDAEAMLDEWVELSRRAYRGELSGIAFLDAVMGDAARAGVPLTYAEELAEGMRMDLRGRSYASLDELREYTFRVASVVGLWLTELFGVRDPWALERAAALGHAMQLTNILRDVGEDARRGRVYLPLDLLDRHGLSPAVVRRMAAGHAPMPAAYPELTEELLRTAEADYREAFAAIPCLPTAAQPPVAVAAFVYRGIHEEIRRRGYDNLRFRARTSATTKLRLASQALRELHAARQAVRERA